MSLLPSRRLVLETSGQLGLCSAVAPSPASGEVLVRILCSAWCGSDLHTACGRRASPGDHIPGHEAVGLVVALGDGPPVVDLRGQPLVLGARVTWSLAAADGTCPLCRRGYPQKCVNLFKYGHAALTTGGDWSGGMADVCLLRRGTAFVILPPDLVDGVAVLANCSVATAVAALRLAGSVDGRALLVTGGGMLGLMVARLALAQGAAAVCLIEPMSDRREKIARLGVDRLFLSPDVPGSTKSLPSVPLVAVEASGATGTAEALLQELDVGGRLILVGAVFPGVKVVWDAEALIRRCLTIQGIHNYTPEDLLVAVDFLTALGRDSDWDGLLSPLWGLSEAAGSLAEAKGGCWLRVRVRPD